MPQAQSPDDNVHAKSGATPLRTLIFGIASGDMEAVDSQLADAIEWDQMP